MSVFFDLATDTIPEDERMPLDTFVRSHGFKPELIMIRMDGEVVRKDDLPLREVIRTSRVRVYKLVGGG